MKLSIRTILRLQLRWILPSAAVRMPRDSRRKSARAALAFGFAAFVVASAALAGVVETAHREWRDPEFGHRMIRLRQWKADAPQRPLVLAVGSSRLQQGIDPASMQLSDGPTEPLVFNFGYRAAAPPIAVLNFFRLLDAGVRPDFLCIEFSPIAIMQEFSGPAVLRKWPNRMTVKDVHWMIDSQFLNFHTPVARGSMARWIATTATPWTSHRQVVLSHWRPEWVTQSQRLTLGSEPMDKYGFTEMSIRTTTTQVYRRDPAASWERFAPIADKTEVAASVRRAYSLLLTRCRAEGIPVAFVWLPLSPLVSGWVNPAARHACSEFAAELSREWGVVVFPPPDWLNDDDFADGHHLLPHAAARYSRWLADTHLKPWLASHSSLSSGRER